MQILSPSALRVNFSLLARVLGLVLFCLLGIRGNVWAEEAEILPLLASAPMLSDPDDSTTKKSTDTTQLKYPIKDKKDYENKQYNNGLDLKDPANIERKTEYDPETGEYKQTEQMGDLDYRQPQNLSLKDLENMSGKEERKNYFKERSKAQNFSSGGVFNTIRLPKVADKLGIGTIDIRPSGSAELTFGGNFNVVRNPAFTTRQQRNGQFLFNQKIQLNVNGSIGDRLKINTSYDTEATFDFDNVTKINWVGKEDDIVKKVEVGNVSLPLNSSLITAGQSLFGVKTQLQFGKLTTTLIFTQQKGKVTETELTGGAQVTPFDIQADNYDVNRHYFLSQFFKDQYDQALANLPVISSGVYVNRVEVWVTNRTANYENARDALVFMDLGEKKPYQPSIANPGAPIYPDNNANQLYSGGNGVSNDPGVRKSSSAITTMKQKYPGFTQGIDYDILNYARQLAPTEYTLNPRLGYISLNQALNNDEILAVAYEYTYNGVPYQVGEFGRDVENNTTDVLMVKMLKGNTIRTNIPTWDLMMKNIYSLGSYNIQAQDFKLNIIYADDPSGADLNYLNVPSTEVNLYQKILLTALKLDHINKQQEPAPDGVFDFIEGVTINSATGRIMFPVREPFGNYLKSQFVDSVLSARYVYQSLYDSTRWLAQQDVSHDKFFIRGTYQGSSTSEISLNSLNVPQGSVKVTANGTPLVEGQDFIVDYTLGKVRIINTGVLNSGAVIKVTSENNSLFNVQQKTIAGARFDYAISKNATIGGTIMHLWERPLTPKVNIGDEPLLNTIFGLDGSFTKDVPLLTRLIDKLPFIETKEMSTITFSGEYAQIIPHEPKTMGKRGTSYMDDFEGAETPFDLKLPSNWRLASTPQGQPDLFPEAGTGLALDFNRKRARLAWYYIDGSVFHYMNSGTTPDYIKSSNSIRSNHWVRPVRYLEVFPNKQFAQGQDPLIQTLDMAFYPNEKGPYNYGVDNMDADGKLLNPEQNWGGITRRIEYNDFEAANIDYIEIWMMDPYANEKQAGIAPTNRGYLYINLGNLSEDVLPDNRKSFENGMPKTSTVEKVDTSAYVGRVPNLPAITNAFDNDPESRPFQDIGLDGLNDADERSFFDTSYLQKVGTQFGTSSRAYQMAFNDPSNDNYRYFLDQPDGNNQPDILTCYRNYNGVEGNSTLSTYGTQKAPKASTTIPDDEDINKDFTLNLTEEYYQYRIEISPEMLSPGKNFVADSSVVQVMNMPDGTKPYVTWYQIKVPIKEFQKQVGAISDFKSIRFMRMFMSGFNDSAVLRFAQLQLVRADWRRYLGDLKKGGLSPSTDPNDETEFVVSTVNIEENGKREPVPYVEPPGIFREQDVTSTNPVQLNEQALSLKVCDLKDGDARGAFKTTKFDIRNYKTLRMYIHAEGEDLHDGDLTAFIRLGTDLTNNYYEYELPLVITLPKTQDAAGIWKGENEIAIDLEEFYATKQERYNVNAPMTTEYTRVIGNRNIKIIGLPDMSNVRVIMLGIRNPRKNAANPDDQPKCGEVWFNELRVSDFTNKGGKAGIGRMSAKLADLGVLNLSGNFTTIGFGGIDKKLNERSLNNTYQYDINASFELGRFFPAKSGVSVPMYIGYTQNISRPKYNPLNPDILLTTTLKTLKTEEEKDRVQKAAEDYQSRYSLNFTNVRKNRVGTGKQHMWDVENFYLTYAYTKVFRRNQSIEFNESRTYHGSVGYAYNFNPKPITPFSGIGRSKHLAVLRETNLFYLPQVFNVRFDADRYYSELKNRNNDNFQAITPEFFDKNFTMTRFYELRYDITRNLKFDYTTTVNARVDEPIGRISTKEQMDTIRQNFFNLGRTTNFNQVMNFNYTVPLSKIPVLNWISMNLRYGANYSWLTAPPAAKTLGNTIQNSQNKSATTQLNMLTLYNKIPLFKDINSGKYNREKKTKGALDTKEQDKKDAKPGDKDKDKKKDNKDKDKPKVGPTGVALARLVMMLKNVNATANITRGILLPGFTKDPNALGNNWSTNAPGIPFIMGSQDPNIRYDLASRGLITSDTNLITPYTQNYTKNLTFKALIEPIQDLRIDLNASVTESKNTVSNFRMNPLTSQFEDLAASDNGTYTVTYNFWRTAFRKDSKDNFSETFQQFQDYRYTMARRLQAEDPRTKGEGTDTLTNFPVGYTRNSTEVLIASFLAAYSGKDPNNSRLSPFPKIPMPSWRITYSGLTRLGSLSEKFSNITLSHSYASTYSTGSYQTSIAFGTPVDTVIPGKSVIPRYDIRTVNFTERFSPLLSVDVTLLNGLTFRAEYRKERLVSLSLQSPQVTESKNNEWIVGGNYVVKGLRTPKINGRRYRLENELTCRLDISVRDMVTIVRKLDVVTNEPSAGSKVVTIKPSIDYTISENLNLHIFYDRRVTKPAISSSFPTALTQFGFTLRYTIQ